MPQRHRHAGWLGLAASLALMATAAGCGSTASPGLSPTAAKELHAGLAAVRTAADAHDRPGALRSLASFSARVRREAAAGHLSPRQARALRTGAGRARRRILAQVTVTTATPAPVPAPVPTIAVPPATTPTAAAPTPSTTAARAPGPTDRKPGTGRDPHAGHDNGRHNDKATGKGKENEQ